MVGQSSRVIRRTVHSIFECSSLIRNCVCLSERSQVKVCASRATFCAWWGYVWTCRWWCSQSAWRSPGGAGELLVSFGCVHLRPSGVASKLKQVACATRPALSHSLRVRYTPRGYTPTHMYKLHGNIGPLVANQLLRKTKRTALFSRWPNRQLATPALHACRSVSPLLLRGSLLLPSHHSISLRRE